MKQVSGWNGEQRRVSLRIPRDSDLNAALGLLWAIALGTAFWVVAGFVWWLKL